MRFQHEHAQYELPDELRPAMLLFLHFDMLRSPQLAGMSFQEFHALDWERQLKLIAVAIGAAKPVEKAERPMEPPAQPTQQLGLL